jgi:hypothetical protein
MTFGVAAAFAPTRGGWPLGASCAVTCAAPLSGAAIDAALGAALGAALAEPATVPVTTSAAQRAYSTFLMTLLNFRPFPLGRCHPGIRAISEIGSPYARAIACRNLVFSSGRKRDKIGGPEVRDGGPADYSRVFRAARSPWSAGRCGQPGFGRLVADRTGWQTLAESALSLGRAFIARSGGIGRSCPTHSDS